MLNRKALAYLQTGMHSEAETMFDESLKIRRMLNEENTPEYAVFRRRDCDGAMR